MKRTAVVIAYLVALASLTPAYAQTPDEPVESAADEPSAVRRSAPRSFLRAYFHVDSTSLTASRTFDAVVGKSRFTMPGGGVEALNLWKGLFARVAFSSTKETGSRVFVLDDEVIPVGIPLTVELAPLEIGGGWRFPAVWSGRVVPYGGAGFVRLGYRETSEFAQSGDNTDTTFNGSVVFGGVEVSLVSWVIAGVEAQYRRVPDAIGDGGVSGAFGETDLGGTTFRVLFGIRR